MNISIRKSAIKDLKKLGARHRDNIHLKIIELKKFPDVKNVKKLTSFEPAYRLRVGGYRIFITVLQLSFSNF